MKSLWKWVLGIAIAVAVIVAAVFGVRYLVSNGYVTMPAAGFVWQDKANREFDDQRGPEMFSNPHGFNDWHDPRGFDGFRGPMGRGHGFGHFGTAFMFIGGLFRLIVFGAFLYGAYWLGKRNARLVLDRAPAAPAAEPAKAPKPRTRKLAKS